MHVVETIIHQFNNNGCYSKVIEAKCGISQGGPISPMIFVIVMEYLHRKLEDLHNIPGFNYHSKCEKVKIVDISFANDLMLFSRGDEVSVKLMMDRFNEFSRATSLVVNPTK